MGPLKVTESRGVKVYNVSSGKTLPQWLSEKKKKSLRKDEEYKSRIEVIQDLEFDIASSRLKSSKDGKFLAATGVYPPQVKVYDLAELSMKFSRNMDCEVVQFCMLSEDYSKMAFLQADRTIEFHAKFGTYYKTRIPRVGRDMCYDPVSCDLIAVGSSNEAYRLNLEQGRFLKPYSVLADAVNCVDRSSVHGLLAFGTEAGTVELWDPRSRKRIGVTDVAKEVNKDLGQLPDIEDNEVADHVTAMRFDPSGLNLAAGTGSGYTALYDLRRSNPVMVKDQQYGQPIVDIRYHNTPEGSYLMAADSKILKIWDQNKNNGELFASVEPPADINDICLFPNSGLLLFATEQPRMHVYFVPALGAAPQWCSFLDTLTEELEETERKQIYEDYRFVTREELDQLGLAGLVGTNMLKPYMHGFFIDAQLYARSKSVVQPFAYEDYRKQRIRDKIDAKQQQRIAVKQPLPKVNKELAEKIIEHKQAAGEKNEEGEDKKKQKSVDKKRIATQTKLLEDDRFKAMFEQKEFQIDRQSQEYKLLHPSEAASDQKPKKEVDEDDEHFDAVDDIDSQASDDDGDVPEEDTRPSRRVNNGAWGNTSTRGMGRDGGNRGKKHKMFEVREGHEAAALQGISGAANGPVGKKARTMSLEQRLQFAQNESKLVQMGNSLSGNKELSFTPIDKKGQGKDGGAGGRRSENSGRKGRSMSGMLPKERSSPGRGGKSFGKKKK